MAEIIKKERTIIKNGELRKLCDRSTISIEDLSSAVGVTSDFLYKFDRGERSITFDLWKKICEFLDKKNR